MTFYEERERLIDEFSDTLDEQDINLAFLDAQKRLVNTPLWRVWDVEVDENGMITPYGVEEFGETIVEKLNKLFLIFFEEELKSYAESYARREE